MYVSDEADARPVHAVAIVGAALRFPGASDPASFHELTVAGRRMFRAVTPRLAGDGRDAFGVPADGLRDGRGLVRAALLDNCVASASAGETARGITGRHVLAAQIAAAALADVPRAGRDAAAGRTGVFIADTPAPGTADVGDWVRRRLELGDAQHDRARPADGIAADSIATIGRNGSHRANGASAQPMLLGTIGLVDLSGQRPLPHGRLPTGLYCSLRAVTQACEALNSGECDLALAGGVSHGVETYWPLRAGPAAAALAKDDVRVYDASPTGMLPGEGCGIVALVRAADAR